MPAVSYLGASSTGHAGFPPRGNTGASGNVFVNGIAVHRQNDPWPTHCNSTPTCHDGVLSGGSATVFVNGQACSRIGDDISCGDAVAEGSPDVFAGG